ncbi:MAG: glycoside hydrolase family 3 N-terminal domain-containing protein [Faecalibacterium sp.]
MLYQDSSVPIAQRVADLLSRMTLQEKVMQTISIDSTSLLVAEEDRPALFAAGELLDEKNCKKLADGMGAFQLPGKNMNPAESGMYRNILQKYVQEHTRLKIPVLSQEECLNGQLARGATMFPRPIGMAGSFNKDLAERVYSAIGRETRARGGHQAFTPVLDIGRDPRWGRIEETFGEDTHLVTEMGMCAVKGLQGGADGVTPDHVVSSPKHFVGYAQGAGGRNFAPSLVTKRALMDEILPPFEAVITKAHVKGIMPSHADLDGVPCHGSHWLLTELLREQWGFDGITISDYNDILRLDILHHVAEDPAAAAAMALRAGMDMDIPGGSAYTYLFDAIEKDPSLEACLDTAVSRILKLKFELGLFENPYVDLAAIDDIVNGVVHKALAREAAQEVPILLKNEGGILPLNQAKLDTIAVIGPTADPVQFSYYSEQPNVGISILDGIRSKVGDTCEVLYAQGCHITKPMTAMETELDVLATNPGLYTPEEEADNIAKAIETAQKAQIAIVCLGSSPNASREAVTLEKHYGDNTNLDLIGQQNMLLEAIAATGVPIVLVLINGKPLSCSYAYQTANAVLEGWYLGQQTGHGIADILFGDVNPSGRLPVTIVRHAGYLPGYYSQKATSFLKGYLFEPEGPLFWFGYGLSYTTFDYQKMRISSAEMRMEDTVTVSVDVKNTGNVAGKEVVQLYISDVKSSVTRSERELKGFEKICLEAGQTKAVSFTIDASMLSFTGLDYQKTVEAGQFKIMVGKNCQDVESLDLWMK